MPRSPDQRATQRRSAHELVMQDASSVNKPSRVLSENDTFAAIRQKPNPLRETDVNNEPNDKLYTLSTVEFPAVQVSVNITCFNT